MLDILSRWGRWNMTFTCCQGRPLNVSYYRLDVEVCTQLIVHVCSDHVQSCMHVMAALPVSHTCMQGHHVNMLFFVVELSTPSASLL